MSRSSLEKSCFAYPAGCFAPVASIRRHPRDLRTNPWSEIVANIPESRGPAWSHWKDDPSFWGVVPSRLNPLISVRRCRRRRL